jgi:hypothetical protein
MSPDFSVKRGPSMVETLATSPIPEKKSRA